MLVAAVLAHLALMVVVPIEVLVEVLVAVVEPLWVVALR